MAEEAATPPTAWPAGSVPEALGLGTAGIDAGDATLRRALDAMGDCLCICSAVRDAAGTLVDFRVEWVNDAACANNRMTREAQLGRLLCELLPAHRTTGLFDDYVRVVETGEPYAQEHCVYRDTYGDGRVLERAFDLRVAKHGDGIVATWRDVTGRVQASTELMRAREHAERLQRFTAALAEAVTTEDVVAAILAHGRVAVGASACAVVRPCADDPAQLEIVGAEGYDVPELAAWARFPLDAPAPMADAMRTAEPVWVAGLDAVEARYPAVLPFALATGFHGWLAIPFVLGENGARRVVGGIGVAFEAPHAVTDDDRDFLHALGRQAAQAFERARLAEALRERDARHVLVAEAVNDGIWDWNVVTGHVHFSDRWAAMLGYTTAEIEPHVRTWERIVHPDDLPDVMRVLEAHLRGETPVYETEHRIRHRDGRWLRIRDRGKVVARDAAGRPLRAIGTHTDVTELHERTAEATRAQALATALVANLPAAAIFVVDHELRYVLAEGEALREAGFAPAHFVGRTLHEALDAATADSYVPYYRDALAGRSFAFEHEVHGRVYLSRGVPLRDETGTVSAALAVSYDITERRHAERERERLVAAVDTERALLGAILEQMPVGVVVVEAPVGAILFANSTAERLMGHPLILVTEAAGYAAYGALHDDDTPFAAHEYPTARALAGETVEQAVMRYRRGDGTVTHLSVSAAPVHDDEGRLVRAVCAWTDVHERVVLEGALRAARDAADAANRAKSEFLANMSHELRTPLNAIQGHVQLLELGIHGPLAEPQREALARVTRAQRHLLGLINDVLNFAKLESGHVEYQLAPIPLGEALRDAAAIIEPQMKAEGLDFTLDVTTPGCVVVADADKLRQVLLNLLSNAAKFTPSGGRVVLEAGRAEGTPAMVHVVVRDTGIGIPAEKQAAVFEPFVQVHAGPTRTQQGTGLGLAISRDLARGMGGDLLLRSAVGEGAEFRLVLPCACDAHR